MTTQYTYTTRKHPRTLHQVLPSGSSTLEKAMVYAYDGQPVPTVIEHLNDADACDARLLNSLAYARNVDYWSMGASEASKRALLKEAVYLHRIKGTRYAVTRALALMGVTTKITEWWQKSPKGEPFTFSVDLLVREGFDDQEVLSASRIEQIIHAVNFWKPVSRHFDFRVGMQYTNQLRVTNTHQRTQVARWTCEARAVHPRPSINTLQLANAIGRGLQVMRLQLEF